MSYEEISAELDQKFTELGQNFGRVRPRIGPELGVKFSKKNPWGLVYSHCQRSILKTTFLG